MWTRSKGPIDLHHSWMISMFPENGTPATSAGETTLILQQPGTSGLQQPGTSGLQHSGTSSLQQPGPSGHQPAPMATTTDSTTTTIPTTATATVPTVSTHAPVISYQPPPQPSNQQIPPGFQIEHKINVQIKPYDGKVSPSQWWQKFLAFITLQHMTDKQAILSLPFHLEDKPSEWFSTLADEAKQSLATIKTANETEQKAKDKERHDLKAKISELSIGDQVLLKIQKTPKGLSRKLYDKSEGPYRIIELGPNYTYKLKRLSDHRIYPSLINATNLRRYYPPGPVRRKYDDPPEAEIPQNNDPPEQNAEINDDTQQQVDGDL